MDVDRPLIEPQDRAAWRDWLVVNHESSSGIWLAVGKKGNRVTRLSYDDAVEEALCFGWIDSTVNRLDADRFKQLFTPRRPKSTWARTNKERVERLTSAGLMTPAGFAAIEVAKENGSWESIDDVESLTVPEDLATALAANPDAERFFGQLRESRHKLALYWITSAKRSATREKRISAIVEAAAQGRMPFDS